MIYLDNASTTPVLPEIMEEMNSFNNLYFSNPMSIYKIAKEPREALDLARKRFADLINVPASKIIFTSSCTEANNMILKSILETTQKHIITTKIEHSSVTAPCKYLETKGIKVDWLYVDEEGFIDFNQLENVLTEETYLISIIHANNEIGTIQDIERVVALAKKYNTPVHIDATQSIGKIPINANQLDVDYLTVSAHKIHGPKGVGGLYAKNPDRLSPFIHGGIHENNLRAGTHNVPGIVGFGKACDIAAQHLSTGQEKLIRLQQEMLQIISQYPNLKLNGPHDLAKRVPGNINFSVRDISGGESLVLKFSMMGIAVSSGSACASGNINPSHVLKAIGNNDQNASSAIRATLSYYNTLEEVHKFGDVLNTILTSSKAASL